MGRSCKNAAEMAVEEVNKAGGLEVAGTKSLMADRRGQRGRTGLSSGSPEVDIPNQILR